MEHINIDIALAKKIGLKESAVLYIIKQKIIESKTARDGTVWTQLSPEDIKIELPFLSLSTIKRILKKLKEIGLIHIKHSETESGTKGKNWISIEEKK